MAPIFLIPLLMKNVSLFNVYYAAEAYGFPRVYRRLLEGIRKVNLPAAQAAVVKQSIKASIRAPSTAYTTLQQAEIIDFVSKYANYAIQASGVPDFIVTAAKIFVKKSTAGKIFDIFMKAAPK